MTAVLITGMSAAGKSTVLAELARRGHAVVDTDVGGWIVATPREDGSTEPMWDEQRISRLLDEHADGTIFVAGCVANQGRFYPRFHAVVLLSAPEETLLERLATRTTNAFGKLEAEHEAVLADLRAVEPLLRAGATAEIDTRTPVAEIAARLSRSPAGRPHPAELTTPGAPARALPRPTAGRGRAAPAGPDVGGALSPRSRARSCSTASPISIAAVTSDRPRPLRRRSVARTSAAGRRTRAGRAAGAGARRTRSAPRRRAARSRLCQVISVAATASLDRTAHPLSAASTLTPPWAE